MKGAKEKIRNALRIFVIVTGILLIFPSVHAEEILKPDILWVPAYENNYNVAHRPNTTDIRYIVIHDIEGYYKNAIDNWQTPNPPSSIHYVISKEGEITQMVEDKNIAWQAGNYKYNAQSIGIEHEGFADTCQFTEEEYIASANLVKWLAQEYDIPLTRLEGLAPADPMNNEGIIGHYQVPHPTNPALGGGERGHYDPGKCWDWDYYMQLLTGVRIYDQKLDLIFLIDTTGSMGDDIAAVKSSASEIVEALDLQASDYRVAVADYRDYPQSPYGQPGLDYYYNLDLEFSNDKDSIINSINSLSLGYGMDWEESVFTALVKSMIDPNKDLNNEDNYGWRKGVNKAIIIMGDAPPHDPEPWVEGYTLKDVAYWSENIDPILVYSVVIGSDSTTYNAFSEISERTGGKVYTSPTASDIVDTIIEAIGDIGETPDLGVTIDINPVINVANPDDTVTYSIGITNTGTIADTYNISIDFENFASGFRGYPTSIQESWTDLDRTSVEIEPDATETVSLTISVPNNWAGMEDVIYPFEVMAKSETDELISNTSAAELKVIANQRSMVEYSRLETIWLSELVQSSSVDDEIKNSLLDKLTSATLKLDQSILNIEGGKYKQANNMLEASQNIINAFINQVEAQYDKKIMQPDAEMLMEEANTILQDIESAQNM